MKFINILTIVLAVLAVIFVCVFMFAPQALGLSGTETTAAYAKYFDPDKITTVKLTISDENWQDMLAHPKDEEYHVVNVEINGDKYDAAAIRTKGMSSLSQVASSDSDRYSFKIKADEYVNGQSFAGLSKFVLNNNFQDASYMKEYVSYQLMTELGVPTPLFSYAEVYINDEYYGLYLMVETVEDDFAERNFGPGYGNLYKPDSIRERDGGADGAMKNKPRNLQNRDNFNADMQKVEGNDRTAGQDAVLPDNPDMDAFAERPDGAGNRAGNGFAGRIPGNMGGNMPGGFGGGAGGQGGGSDLVYTDDSLSSYPNIFDNTVNPRADTASSKMRVVEALKHLNEGTELGKYIDVDEVLRYIAVNTAVVSLDSYAGSSRHNYYLYENGGKLSMIPWDYNQAFGAFQSGTSDSANFPIDTPVASGIKLTDRPMIGSLLAVDEYKELYHKYLNEICDYMENTSLKKIDELDAMISSYVQTDPTAFYTFEQYKNGVANLKQFITLRVQSMRRQLHGTIPSTWDGQNADSSTLVDAGDLVIPGGFGGGGFGGGNFPGGNFNPGQEFGRQGGQNPPAMP